MWLGAVVLVALAMAAARAQAEADARLVRTAQGPVRGYRSPEGFFVFHSIPYASAPTGRDRFKAPLPPPAWVTPFEAIDKGIVCPQTDYMFPISQSKNIQEDCLIATVYVPDTEETNLPVVVYVHGGAYQIGYGEMASPKNLLKSKALIAVTFNYRLGAHGFLCLGTENAPGNAGMKDQVALLRWVNQNIPSFGGNPNDVTIAGYSAGSSAVDLLQLSKITTGLFNKVIPESGANLALWSAQLDPVGYAKSFAKTLNFTVDDIYALEEFYLTLPFDLLNSGPFLHIPDTTIYFTPCVERDTGVERFLEESPLTILKNGNYNKLPMLYGFADMEGLFRIPQGFSEWKDRMNERFSEFLPADLQFKNQEEKDAVARRVKEFYFDDKVISEATILGYINYFSDVMFGYSTLRSVRLQVEAGNNDIYLYEYSFYDEAMPPVPGWNLEVKGAPHCAQTMAVLDGHFSDPSTFTERYNKMRAVTQELWINFITKGTPVPPEAALPAWPAAGADGAPHMSLREPLELRGALLAERTRLWDEVYERHYRAPAPPPPPPSRPVRARTEL